MTPRQARVALVGFLFLAAGVTINAVFMQGRPAAATAAKPAEPAPARATSRTGKAPATPPATRKETSAPRAAFDEQPMRIARFGPDLTKLGVVPEAQSEPAANAETIRAIQRELGQRGYGPLSGDGVVGLATRAAVMAFEHDQGLALTGEPSDRLLKRILLGGPAEAVRTTRVASPQAEDVIRIVQRRLAALGYQGGRSDGRLGDDTVKAIREFELDQAVPRAAYPPTWWLASTSRGPLPHRAAEPSSRAAFAIASRCSRGDGSLWHPACPPLRHPGAASADRHARDQAGTHASLRYILRQCPCRTHPHDRRGYSRRLTHQVRRIVLHNGIEEQAVGCLGPGLVPLTRFARRRRRMTAATPGLRMKALDVGGRNPEGKWDTLPKSPANPMKSITCIEDLRQIASRKVPRAFFDYAEPGSYSQQTLAANRADLERIKLRQRVLVDVDHATSPPPSSASRCRCRWRWRRSA